MNKCLILTDLTYQTKSSSRAVHDIEAGLNNMGVASVKVYQLPYESLEDPEAFLQLATNALNFPSQQCRRTHQHHRAHLDLFRIID